MHGAFPQSSRDNPAKPLGTFTGLKPHLGLEERDWSALTFSCSNCVFAKDGRIYAREACVMLNFVHGDTLVKK